MNFSLDTGLSILGIALGMAAIVMAIPPLLQMFYGRPQLEIAADEFTGPDGKQLIIAIKNKQTEKRLLRRLGVEREVGNVLAFFDIQEQGTNRFLNRHISGLLQCAPTREIGLLARAHPMFTVGISIIHAKDQNTWIIDGRKEENFDKISPGDYRALVTIICGEQIHNVSREFRVGNAQHETFWV